MIGKFQTFRKVWGAFRQLIKSSTATLYTVHKQGNLRGTAGLLIKPSLSLEKITLLVTGRNSVGKPLAWEEAGLPLKLQAFQLM